jgi:hypothetical protein
MFVWLYDEVKSTYFAWLPVKRISRMTAQKSPRDRLRSTSAPKLIQYPTHNPPPPRFLPILIRIHTRRPPSLTLHPPSKRIIPLLPRPSSHRPAWYPPSRRSW